MKNKAMREWRNNVSYFETNKDRIRKEYGEQTYVVIEDQQIIDTGLDNMVLAEKYISKQVLITSIKDSERVVKIPSLY